MFFQKTLYNFVYFIYWCGVTVVTADLNIITQSLVLC